MNKVIGVLIVAGGSLMSALPAFAAPPPPPPPPQPHIQFGLNFGSSPPPHFNGPYDDECLSTGEIISDVRSMGFRSVRFLGDDGDVITLRARLGYKRYLLEVDDCSGDLVSRRRIS